MITRTYCVCCLQRPHPLFCRGLITKYMNNNISSTSLSIWGAKQFSDFFEKKLASLLLLQYMGSISVSITKQCMHSHHQFTFEQIWTDLALLHLPSHQPLWAWVPPRCIWAHTVGYVSPFLAVCIGLTSALWNPESSLRDLRNMAEFCSLSGTWGPAPLFPHWRA